MAPPLSVATALPPLRLMSDYQVSLVNNKMSEFTVKFHGPAESEWESYTHPQPVQFAAPL
jgi:hypothetical protein